MRFATTSPLLQVRYYKSATTSLLLQFCYYNSATTILLLQFCYYKSEGLLPKPKRTPRVIGSKAMRMLSESILPVAQGGTGFSLKEFSELMALSAECESWTCGDVKLVAEKKWEAIEEKFLELQKMKAALQQITDASVVGGKSAVHCSILNGLAVEKSKLGNL